MKELRYCEQKYNEEFDIMIKPYLTRVELEVILRDIVDYDETHYKAGSNDENTPELADDVIGRHVLTDLLLLKIATNISDEVDDEVLLTDNFYDLALQNGLIDTVKKEVKNAYMIDEYYNEYMSVSRVTKRLLTDLAMSFDKVTKSLPKTQKGWESLANKFTKAVKVNSNGFDLSKAN